MEFINIQPKPINLQSTKIEIKIVNLELNIRTYVVVKFYSDDSKLLNIEDFLLDGEDYANWTNDNYLINYVCNKYNLQLI